MNKIAILYIPVLHSGYLKFLRDFLNENIIAEENSKWRDDLAYDDQNMTQKDHKKDYIWGMESEIAKKNDAPNRGIWLLDAGLLADYAPTQKDIHALQIEEIADSLSILLTGEKIRIIKEKSVLLAGVSELQFEQSEFELIMPNEEAMRDLVGESNVLANARIVWKNVFLRWDRVNAKAHQEPGVDEEISAGDFDKQIMSLARREGDKSADWWRQVGAILLDSDGEIMAEAHNLHLPHEQQPNVEGDIRAQFHQGEDWELGTAIHAEADLIAKAAARGLSVAGKIIYVTDFPCPNCAKLIARAEIKTLFYQKGYVLSDGERVLKAAGVRIIKVVD